MSKGLRSKILEDTPQTEYKYLAGDYNITQKDFEALIESVASQTPAETPYDRYVFNRLGQFRYDKLNKWWGHQIDIGVEKKCECPYDEHFLTNEKVVYL